MKKSKKIEKTGWHVVKIKDVLSYERPDKYIVKSTKYKDSDGIPVLTANKSFILGYTEEDFGVYEDVPVIIFDDFTTDCKYVDFPFKVKSSAIKILKAKNNTVNLRYIFEVMKLIDFPVGNHKRYYISQYQEQEITIPNKTEQDRIMNVLEKVDSKLENINLIYKETEKLKRGLAMDLINGRIEFNK